MIVVGRCRFGVFCKCGGWCLVVVCGTFRVCGLIFGLFDYY